MEQVQFDETAKFDELFQHLKTKGEAEYAAALEHSDAAGPPEGLPQKAFVARYIKQTTWLQLEKSLEHAGLGKQNLEHEANGAAADAPNIAAPASLAPATSAPAAPDIASSASLLPTTPSVVAVISTCTRVNSLVDAVRSALNQTHPVVEVMVVIDGGGEHCHDLKKVESLVGAARVTVLKGDPCPAKGSCGHAGRARQHGILHADPR